MTPEENAAIVEFLEWSFVKEDVQLVDTSCGWTEDWDPLDNEQIKALLTRYAKHTEPRGGES